MCRRPFAFWFPPSAFWRGAIAQLGERLLCKQEVVGSIPSGSTSGFEFVQEAYVSRPSIGLSAFRRRVISDIVKRRSLRAFGRDASLAWTRLLQTRTQSASQGASARPQFMSACLTAGPSDRSRSKLVFLINVRLRERAYALSPVTTPSGWALIMRAIKCLKGIRWMPWR